jgi:hypothetical protein
MSLDYHTLRDSTTVGSTPLPQPTSAMDISTSFGSEWFHAGILDPNGANAKLVFLDIFCIWHVLEASWYMPYSGVCQCGREQETGGWFPSPTAQQHTRHIIANWILNIKLCDVINLCSLNGARFSSYFRPKSKKHSSVFSRLIRFGGCLWAILAGCGLEDLITNRLAKHARQMQCAATLHAWSKCHLLESQY